eukprot:SAG31_NODE_32639_length_353_cov_0.814961_1_plen_31_part_10
MATTYSQLVARTYLTPFRPPAPPPPPPPHPP